MIEGIIDIIDKNYINKNLSIPIINALQDSIKNNKFEKITTPNKFTEALRNDLLDISKDHHFNVGYDPEWIKEYFLSITPEQKALSLKNNLKKWQQDNFAFKEVKILEGNIGYIDFTYFHDPEYASKTAASAMHFVSETDALIFDLRNNNGGVLEMAQFLISYLFTNDDYKLLFDYVVRENGKDINRSQWVLPSIPGRRYSKPVYVLTSNFTFSAAEWFAYVLKNLDRATIVGEKTVGGSHPVIEKIINKNFYINVPYGQLKDPTTGGDFEGIGVQPHIISYAKDAIYVAHIEILKKLLKSNVNNTDLYEWSLPIVQSRLSPIKISNKKLNKYKGTYGNIELKLFEGKLYYSWHGTGKSPLTAISEDEFILDGTSEFKIKFQFKEKEVIGFSRIFKNGNSINLKKLKKQ